MIALGPLLSVLLQTAPVPALLDFPEPGLDDPVAYRGYRTRIFRDARGNPVQVILDRRSGRVAFVWADAADQSIAFTARDSAGAPAALAWESSSATVATSGGRRSFALRLRAPPGPLTLGHFALGTMRWERDLQYQGRHLAPFDSVLPPVPEMAELVRRLEALEPAERGKQLALLGAKDVAALRARLKTAMTFHDHGDPWTARVEHVSLDGKSHLTLELRGHSAACTAALAGDRLIVRANGAGPCVLEARIETDAASLTALTREQIFNAEFLGFCERVRRHGAAAPRFRRLEREVRGMEVLAFREKLMAGLPNFATYFGRDMLVTALMMEPVWSPAMLENVIASALRKLSDGGEVSHEEALGEQAIRENAARASDLLAAAETAQPAARDTLYARARDVLARLQSVRENFQMLDDDFQLPVVVARYLAHAGVSADAKRQFLLASARPGETVTRLQALLRNFACVAGRAVAYARAPSVENLVAFAPREGGGFLPGSWRDSGAGYAGGRYAMDINAIWVPEALGAIETSLGVLRTLGLAGTADSGAGTALDEFLREPGALERARERWAGASRHFEVRIPMSEAREKIAAWLAWLPEDERRLWRAAADSTRAPGDTLRFLALSLDAQGQPIPVVNTDPAQMVFLGAVKPAEALERIRPLLTPYPFGLFVPGLGPLVSNDAFAPREVWEAFQRDPYHSPHVVWGREVNLLLLGLAQQARAAGEGTAPGRALRGALEETRAAVEASGLGHEELWSYKVDGDSLRPVRYGASCDVQLWNLTDLAVRYTLDRLPPYGKTSASPSADDHP